MSTAAQAGAPGVTNSRLGPRSLRMTGRMVAYVLASLALLVLVLAGGAFASYRSSIARAENQATNTVRLMSREVARLIQSADLVLAQTAALAEGTDWSDTASRAAAAYDLAALKGFLPDAYHLSIFDRDGRPRLSTSPDFDSTVNVSDRAYFQAQRAADAGLYIGDPLRSKVDGRVIFMLSRRINGPDGGFGGVATLSFNPEVIGAFYHALEVLPGSAFVWAKTDGHVLVREPRPDTEPDTGVRTEELAKLVARRPNGRYDYVSAYDGVARTSFYRQVDDYPLLVSYGVSWPAVRAEWLRESTPFFAFGGLALGALLAAAGFALHWARAEDAYRAQVVQLGRNLAAANESLEQRVALRTTELAAALQDKDRLLDDKDALLEQKELLVKEIDHRVKNSLQLVTAMLRLQGSRAAPEVRRQFAAAIARVTAIARVHDRLYRSDDVRRVELLAYLRELAADLAATGGAEGRWQVRVEGEPADISPERAVPVGLVVSELVTNAFKHAQPAGDRPQDWEILVEVERAAPGRLRVSVRDRGAGFDAGKLGGEGSGLGHKLLAGLADQLGGRLEIEDAAPGARVLLEFPV